MVDLVPVWLTAAGTIATVAEDDAVSVPISLVEKITVGGVATQSFVKIGADFSRAIKVEIGGVDTPFQLDIVDQAVIWEKPLKAAQAIVVTLRPNLSYRLLNGVMPPGLSLDQSTGIISGVVGNVLATEGFRFTVRVQNAAHVRDRTFVIVANPRSYPAEFVDASLPAPYAEPALGGRPVHLLATLDRGQPYAFTLDILDRDGVVAPLQVRSATGLSLSLSVFGGLPPDLAISGSTIKGAIDTLACPGRYLFEVHVLDDLAPSFRTFAIDVTSFFSGGGAPPEVIWDTPAGELGEIPETEPSHHEIKAHTRSTKIQISYSLAPGSAPLPGNLRLDEVTGRLIGIFPHVPADTQVRFTARARAGTVFSDRTFWVTVKNRYSTPYITRLALKLRVNERYALLPAYEAIPESMIYRTEDPSFGRLRTGEVYLLKGLNGSGDLNEAISGDGNPPGRVTKDYHTPFRLVLGTHRFALARDAYGRVVYEVLFRELYDPQAKAGGFVRTSEFVSEDKVRWAQDTRYAVFPDSVRNIRYDLVDDVKLAVDDTTQQRHIGLDGPEIMPLWMRSEQVAGDPSSRVGFHLGIPIAYLNPGSIKAATKILKENVEVIKGSGEVYDFDKYYTTTQLIEAATSFDNDGVHFDNPRTLFDAVFGEVTQIIKYLG